MRLLGLISFVVVALTSCQSKAPSLNRVIYQPVYAKGFQISLANQDTVLELLNDKKEVIETISLKAKPKRIASLSTTCYYFLKELEALQAVVGQGYLDRIQDELKTGFAIQNLSENGDLIKERLIQLQPDCILAIPFDQQNWEALFPQAQVVNMAEYQETHPLGRTEWIVALGYVLHKSNMALAVFHRVVQAYQSAKQQNFRSAIPNVVFAADNGADFTIASKRSFWSILVEDAGGKYCSYESEGNQIQQLEGMLVLLGNADFYGELVYAPESENIDLFEKRKSFHQTQPFISKQLFYCNSAQNQFFDKGVMEPQLMLEDLRAILENNTTHEGVYFKRN